MASRRPDYIIAAAVLLLTIVGMVMICSASAVAAELNFNDPYYFVKRQLLWAVIGFAGMAVLTRIDYHCWQRYAAPALCLTLLLLILVLIPGLGRVVNGARRWLGAGGVYLQPSELAKLTLIFFISRRLERTEKIESFGRGVLPQLLPAAAVCLLILGEPDLGTALSIAAVVYGLLFAAGAGMRQLGLLLLAGIAAVTAAVAVEPYRLKRLTAFADPWADPLGAGYHIIQSLYAIGSGGLFGVGLGESREKFLYLPEPHTDFIFAILAEEMGLLGTWLVLILFFVLAWRGMRIALLATDISGSLLAAGLTVMIFLQAMMNIAVVTASMPVTGIPLPFMSFGGSALIFNLAAMGILLNISRWAQLK